MKRICVPVYVLALVGFLRCVGVAVERVHDEIDVITVSTSRLELSARQGAFRDSAPLV